MNVVIWARVSSREQAEGYSIDAQLRATREKASREGWEIEREFTVAESAKRGADRAKFNKMVKWVKKNARKKSLGGLLSHKLDRVCRNMRDAVRLQELEDECGVQLCFVENDFGSGPAGALSFNVMAAVSQYYSDNLRQEVLKGMNEKVRQGWPAWHAPFGYMNVKDNPEEPVRPHPEKSETVMRIFELYSRGNQTFESLADQLEKEGHTHSPSRPRFFRTSLSYILNNRFYIGEMEWHGKVYPGRYRPIIDRTTFQRCQDLLSGKNRRTSRTNLPLAGNLFTCTYCGQAMTGERIRRPLKDGRVRIHIYYRCANNKPGPEHPKVRWRSQDLEEAIYEDLKGLRIEDGEIREWFRSYLESITGDIGAQRRQRRKVLVKRRTELTGMQERLLDAYLSGTISEDVFHMKSMEIKAQVEETKKALAELDYAADKEPLNGDLALSVFDWSQKVADIWWRSNSGPRREILEAVCLNRAVDDVTLYVQKRKPFCFLAEGLDFHDGRGARI